MSPTFVHKHVLSLVVQFATHEFRLIFGESVRNPRRTPHQRQIFTVKKQRNIIFKRLRNRQRSRRKRRKQKKQQQLVPLSPHQFQILQRRKVAMQLTHSQQSEREAIKPNWRPKPNKQKLTILPGRPANNKPMPILWWKLKRNLQEQFVKPV